MRSLIIVGYVWQILGREAFLSPHSLVAPKKPILNRVNMFKKSGKNLHSSNIFVNGSYEQISRHIHNWCAVRFGTIYTISKTWKRHGGVLLLETLLKCNTPSWVFFAFLKWYKWYQIAQRITCIFQRGNKYRHYGKLLAIYLQSWHMFIAWCFEEVAVA